MQAAQGSMVRRTLPYLRKLAPGQERSRLGTPSPAATACTPTPPSSKKAVFPQQGRISAVAAETRVLGHAVRVLLSARTSLQLWTSRGKGSIGLQACWPVFESWTRLFSRFDLMRRETGAIYRLPIPASVSKQVYMYVCIYHSIRLKGKTALPLPNLKKKEGCKKMDPGWPGEKGIHQSGARAMRVGQQRSSAWVRITRRSRASPHTFLPGFNLRQCRCLQRRRTRPTRAQVRGKGN